MCIHNYLQTSLNRSAECFFILYLQYVHVKFAILVDKLIILTCFPPTHEQYLLKAFETVQLEGSDSVWFSVHSVFSCILNN